jgi:hypothetical protein
MHREYLGVEITFDDREWNTFLLVFGADGVHCGVRELSFGPESEFERFLGYYVEDLISKIPVTV